MVATRTMSTARMLLWSLVVSLLFCSQGSHAQQQADLEAVEEEAPEQRRQLWDFWSLLFSTFLK
jgi:hypothetical protein